MISRLNPEVVEAYLEYQGFKGMPRVDRGHYTSASAQDSVAEAPESIKVKSLDLTAVDVLQLQQ